MCFRWDLEIAISIDIHTVIAFQVGFRIAISIDIHTVIVFQVGYMAARIVDEGETVVLLTGRVHKDYEGKSYIDVLGRYLGSLAVQQGVTLILSVKKSSEFLEMPIVTERYKHLYNVVSID